MIDCTGDADVAVLSGVPYEKGNPETGDNQPISLRYTMSGIDIQKFISFMKDIRLSELKGEEVREEEQNLYN